MHAGDVLGSVGITYKCKQCGWAEFRVSPRVSPILKCAGTTIGPKLHTLTVQKVDQQAGQRLGGEQREGDDEGIRHEGPVPPPVLY